MKILTDADFAKIKSECDFHHMAWARGYVSRKTPGQFTEYAGKYGKGYVIYTPTDKSTRYCIKTYYIEKQKGN